MQGGLEWFLCLEPPSRVLQEGEGLVGDDALADEAEGVEGDPQGVPTVV